MSLPATNSIPLSDRVSRRFSNFVVDNYKWIVVAWLVLAVVSKMMAPSWKQVALDGDFEYLPADKTSVAAGKLLDDAFAGTRSRSQMVVALGRQSGQWTADDQLLGLDILRRLYHRLAEVAWLRANKETSLASVSALPRHSAAKPPVEEPPRSIIPLTPQAMPKVPNRWFTVALEALDQAIEADAKFYEMLGERVPETQPTPYEPRLAIAYWDRATLRQKVGGDPEQVASDFESALLLDRDMNDSVSMLRDRDLGAWSSLLDVYSWEDAVIGAQLQRPSARLVVLTLSSELAATGNIALLEQLQSIVDETIGYRDEYLLPEQLGPARDLRVLVTGSAAIGGQTLAAARAAITYTEWFTIGMILLILAVVYRAPLLVAVPVFSIAIAVMVSTAIVTFITHASREGWLGGLDLRIYTTSRIFVVVILFGAGTDYCLFLIARLREEAAKHTWTDACQRSLSNVSGALLGSALTTIVGLGMLWFADFGKFHHTGPIIAICLTVGLLVCMTLTPAILRMLGPAVFWPTKLGQKSAMPKLSLLGNSSVGEKRGKPGGRFWNAMAIALTRQPVWTLVGGFVLLVWPSWIGFQNEQSVTYNLSGQLATTASSRQGMRLLDRQFGVGQLAPISVLVLANQSQSEESLNEFREKFATAMYAVEGVSRVRSVSDPLGDFPPDRDMGLLSRDAWRRLALQNHRLARSHFVSSDPMFQQRLIRIDIVVQEDPFSLAAAERLAAVQEQVDWFLESQSEEISWQRFYAGTTPSIVDLREVTLSDTRRIKLAVIAAVFVVLIIVIRRITLSVYLIATVLLSYYATLGLTYLFFRMIDGPDFPGLDWKLPLFLFVILVAVGQDYNVYLVTRIMEERKRLGSLAAVRRAVARTGGIVTACGFVMAATFLSMTASAWMPWLLGMVGATISGLGLMDRESWAGGVIAVSESASGTSGQNTLRGITELGFALGLGVLIDTLYVRTVLVPSFVVIHDRIRRRRSK